MAVLRPDPLLLVADMLIVCAALLLAWHEFQMAMWQPTDTHQREKRERYSQWLRERTRVA